MRSKLARWWIPDTRGRSEAGKTLEFWFGEHCQEMRVTALEPGRLVCWRATEKGLADWVGSEIEFACRRGAARPSSSSATRGGPAMRPSSAYCSMSWAVFLLSLKELVEKGKGFPFPTSGSTSDRRDGHARHHASDQDPRLGRARLPGAHHGGGIHGWWTRDADLDDGSAERANSASMAARASPACASRR